MEKLQDLLSKHDLCDKVKMSGTFCMGQCQKGVCVTLDDVHYSVTPDNVEDFFNKNILHNK